MVKINQVYGEDLQVEGAKDWIKKLLENQAGPREVQEIFNLLFKLDKQGKAEVEAELGVEFNCEIEESILENEIKNLSFLESYQEKIKEAKEEGGKVYWKQWNEDCRSKSEECDVDIVTLYVHSDGKVEKERIHTH